MKYKILFVFCVVVAFLFGLTWQVNYMSPYGEARGRVRVRQRILGIEYIYSWAGPGFNRFSGPDWDIRRYQSKFPFPD